MEQNNKVNSFRDLEELIDLSEKTSDKINRIKDRIANIKAGLLILGIITYGAFSAGFYYGQNIATDINAPWIKIFLTIAATFLAGLFVYSAKIVLDALHKLKKIRKELDTETMIQRRLLIMIYDQLNIVRSEERLSIVHFALLEMRIQRLQGSQ